MIIDMTQIKELVKDQLTVADAKKAKKIMRSIGACLDDLALRLKTANMITYYSQTVAASTREVNLTGNNNDLRYILHVKYGTGEEQALLEYVAPKKFIEEYDNPSADAAVPTYYTIIYHSSGFPTIKFNAPTESSDTLLVYYFIDPTPDNIAHFRSSSMISVGALAFFFGLQTEPGLALYSIYQGMVKLAREGDSPMANPQVKFIMNKFDRDARSIAQGYNDARF